MTSKTLSDRLVGRGPEIASVRSFLLGASDGRRVLTFTGPPGIGKTAMLDCAAEMAVQWRVLRCNGVPSETDMAFAGLNQLLTPLQGLITELYAPMSETLSAAIGLSGGHRPGVEAVAEAVLSLMAVDPDSKPWLVLLDDLQWLDTASIDVLRMVAELGSGIRMKLVAAHRRDSHLGWTGAAVHAHSLQPLTDSEAVDVLLARFPESSSPARQRLIAEAAGNPLVLLELSRTTAGRQWGHPMSGYADVDLTPRLNTLYADDIADLPGPMRRTLLVAALTRNPKVSIVQAAAGECDVHTVLRALHDRRLVDVDERQRIRFANQLVKHAVVSASTSDERYAAHRALASAMTDRPDHRVWHLGEATSEPDDGMAALLEQKAHDWRQSGDVTAAVSALYRSADLSVDAVERQRRRALAHYVDARLSGESPRITAQMGPTVRVQPGSPAALQSAIAAAYVAFDEDANIDFAHRVLVNALDDALDSAECNDDLILDALEILLTVSKYAASKDMWNSFYAVMGRATVPETSLLRLRTHLVADPARTAATAVDQLDESILRLTSQRDPTLVTRLAAAAHYVDRVRTFRSELLQLSESARANGSLSLAISAMMPVCIDDVRTGRWLDADTLTAECLDMCRATGFSLQSWPLRLAGAWLAAGRGDDASSRQVTAEVLRWASSSGAGGAVRFAYQVRAFSALTQGNWEEAYVLASAVSLPGTLESNVGHALWAAFDMVEAAVRAGHAKEAAAHAAALRDSQVALVSSRLALVVAGSTAMTASDEDFVELFDRALAMPGAADWPMERARLNLVYGERLRRHRMITKARSHLNTAVQDFAVIGAATWRARSQAEFDATGHRSRDGSGVGALTPQEFQVARLAATGLTNKAIAERLAISHRTVGAHLERSMPKLGVNSRAGLRRAIEGLSDAPPGGAR